MKSNDEERETMETGTTPGPEDLLDSLPRRRKIFFGFCGLLLLVLVGGNVLYGTVLTTRRSRSYCLGCHRFSGPARMWEPSERHSEGLTCSQCHGLLPSQRGRCGAFSARPETVDPNCMGCHPSVLEGRVAEETVRIRLAGPGKEGAKTYAWPLKDLMYTWHLRNRVCVCTDCHRNISHEKEAGATGHRPKTAYCAACHYHAAKDDYARCRPLPLLEVADASGKDGGNGDRASGRGR